MFRLYTSLLISTSMLFQFASPVFAMYDDSIDTTGSIDFDTIPTPGRRAFFVHNPKNPTQKILLTPSFHPLTRHFILPHLAKEMREKDILITESHTSALSWDDEEKVKEIIGDLTIEDLRLAEVIRDQPFTISYPEESQEPWTYDIKLQFPDDDFEPMEKLFKPFLGEIPLQNMHPWFVSYVLGGIVHNKNNFFGMDCQITRDFNLNGKPVFEVERPVRKFNLKSIKNHVVSFELMDKISLMALMAKEMIPKTVLDIRKKKLDELSEVPWTKEIEDQWDKSSNVSSRTRFWFLKLLEYFEMYSNKSFSVVWGAAHFPGENGILTLLSKAGFTITRFEEEAPDVVIVRPLVKSEKLQTEIQQIALQAEEKKASIAQEYQEARSKVNTALQYGLPQIVETYESPEDASSIRHELINAVVKLGRAGVVSDIPTLLQYISTRNKIHADTAITNKAFALEMLERNPQFDLNLIKSKIGLL